MRTMIYLSLAINILVLIPIVVLMAIKSPMVDYAWGDFTAARGILMSIYLSILVVSVFLVFKPVPSFVAALLIVQVVYKLTTPFTVGTVLNPIVISNLAISIFHIATLVTIFAFMGHRILQTN